MAFLFLVELGIMAASLVAAYYLRPDTAPPKETSVNTAMPRAEEGHAIPLVYGTVRVRSPLVIALGNPYATPLKENDITVGYDYEVGVRMVLCRGNVPHGTTTGGATLIKLYAGDHPLDGMDPLTLSPYAPTVGNTTYNCYDHTMFAEVPGSPNGNIGTAILYGGRWDQEVHPVDVLDDYEDNEIGLGVDRRIPYRGQVVLSFRGTSINGWRTGGATTLPMYQPVIHNPITIPGYESQTGPIGDGDANPAAILHDLLTSQWGGLGSDTATVDVDSFVACAVTLANEGMGLSMYITGDRTGRDVVAELLKHIDGVMYEEPFTGKQVLKLIRADYDVGTIYTATPSKIEDIEITSNLWGETINEVLVSFTDAAKNWATGTEPAQNSANINSQGGRRRSARYDFPWITSSSIAARIAARELMLSSLPLMRCKLRLNRSGFALRPGDPIRVTYPEWGIDAIFRVHVPATGTVQDGAVSFIAVQDRFSVTHTSFDIPWPLPDIAPTPTPINLRVITEAPRWIALKAYEQGFIANVDGPRGYYLAAPPTSQESRYRVMLDSSADTPSRAFPGRFRLAAAYARHHGPFDSTTGISIDGVEGWTPTTTTDAMIASEGANLLLIDKELIAFRTATDAGGGAWTLSNVWRGVLDTVPADHADNAVGYVLPGRFAVGSLGGNVLTHGTTYDAATLSAVASSWTPEAVAPADILTVTSRTLRPYAPDAVEVNASQQPTAITEEGVTIEGTARDRLRGAITRPDAGAETIEAGTSYAAVAYAEGEDPLAGGAQVTLATGYDDTDIAASVGPLPLGAAGHGTIEVGLEARRTVTLPDATSAALTSWQPATVPIVAHHYRNLLLNPRFATSGQAWTFTTGTPSYTSGASGLGGGGSYLTTSSATLDGYQDVPISGYRPGGYRALLRFAIGPLSDANDTVSVVMTSRNAAGTTLDTATYSASSPTTWQWQTLEIAALDPATAAIRVRVILAAVGELDTVASVALTECRLQVGQITGQLLTNPSFESTITTGWTESVGTWQQLTSPTYGSANFARPNNGASAQLYQDVTPTAGWESSSVAVLELGRMNDDASDTGTVTITARDSGGTTLATATTGAEAISPSNVWQRRILFLELPATTATVRVTLDATRVAGTPLNTCFDDLDLRIHTHLAADESLVLDFSTERHTQALPADRFEWTRDFPSCPIPNHGILAGATIGGLGTEPLIEATGAALMGATCVIDQGANGMTAAGYETPGNGTGTSGDGIQVAPVGSSFANFGAGASWAGLFAARWSATSAPGSTVALASRYSAGKGWRIDLGTTGIPTLRVEDGTNAASVTATDAVDHGDWFVVGMHYDSTTGYLSIIDRSAVVTVDVATFSVGEWLHSDAIRFQLFNSSSGLATFPGQIARVYLWRSTVPTTTQLQACITTHVRPAAWGTITTYSRTQTIAVPTSNASTGPLIERFAPSRVAVGGTADDPDHRGLITARQLAAVATTTFTGWASAGGTITDAVATDPTGFKVACTINGTSSQGRYVAKTLGSAGTIYVRIMVRADVATNVRVGLDDSGGTSQASAAYSATSAWTVITVPLAWTGATGGAGRVRISGSSTGTAGTIYLSPLVYVGAEHPGPGWPLGGTASACYATADASALTVRANHAGEIETDLIDGALGSVAGITVRLHNGTNSNDARLIGGTSSYDTTGAVLDGTASGSTATFFDDDLPIVSLTTARLRWHRAGLPDHTAAYARIDRTADGFGTFYGADVRTATWTPSTTVLDVLDLGHSGGSDVWPGAIAKVTIRARERKD